MRMSKLSWWLRAIRTSPEKALHLLGLRLVADAGRVFRDAWSSRLMILAGLLTGAEYVLQSFKDLPQWLTVVTGFVIAAALISRVVVQRNISK